jgi:hypothetical protein
MENKKIEKLARLSLLDNNTQEIRDRLGIHSAKDFVEHIAKTLNCDIKSAQEIIKNSTELMQLMFAVA